MNIYLLIILFVFALFVVSGSVWAEVTLDGTLGRSGAVSGPNYRITADLGRQVGTNLFHSFGKFNVSTGESAIFAGPGLISNIISRVTGGTSSSIDGLLRSEINGANLYLLNPAGVMFGPNASLDVTGSFYVTTADYLKLGQDGIFYANPSGNSILTSSPPSAFGFMGSNPAGISVEGSFLKAAAGKSISLIGGDLSIKNGTLHAPSGTINLISVASPGEAVISGSGFETGSFEKLGTIEISDARLDNERPFYDFKTNTHMGNLDASGGDSGGGIFIRGGRFVLDNGQLSADTYGSGNALGADIKLREDLTASNESLITSATLGGGKGGDILIDVKKLALSGGSAFDTPTKGTGMGGSLTIRASDSVSMSGSKGTSMSGIYNNAFGEGNGGIVSVTTPNMTMDKGAVIQSATESSGNAGETYLNTGNLLITGGAYITTTSFGPGNAGILNITSTESISLSGADSGIYCNTFSSGAGGSSIITTPVLNISNRATIQSAAVGTGNGGDLYIKVGNLFLTGWGSEINTSSYGAGRGGSLHIDASEAIALSDWGRIANRAIAGGDGGNTFIKAPVLSLHDNGAIEAGTRGSGMSGDIFIDVGKLTNDGSSSWINASSSGAGNGGNITINASESISLLDYGSITNTMYKDSSGNGGKIFIATPSLIMDRGNIEGIIAVDSSAKTGSDIIIKAGKVALNNWSNITSDNYSTGNAGSISMDAKESVLVSDSWISAETHRSGQGGNITINTPYLKMEKGNYITTTSNILATGAAGSIQLNVGSLAVNDSHISSDTWGSGKGGNITINASKSIDVSNSWIISAAGHKGGDGGNISITTGSLSITDGSHITSTGNNVGKGGNISVEASGNVLLSGSHIDSSAAYGSDTYTGSGSGGSISIKAASFTSDGGQIRAGTTWTGNAGNVTLDVGKLELKNNSEIDVYTHGAGRGGDLTINAAESLLISGSEIQAAVGKSGDGGTISIKSPNVQMDDASIYAVRSGTGQGVTMHFDVGKLALSNTVINMENLSDTGTGGNLDINASESVAISYGGISGENYGNGAGAAITITTPSLHLNNYGYITTSNYGGGNGGSIFIKASDSVSISGYETYYGVGVYSSGISSETFGKGNAGAISIEAGKLSLTDLGKISTDAREGSEGNAGNIFIKASDSVSISGNMFYEGIVYPSWITSQTYGKGNAGTVSIETGKLSLTDLGSISTSAREGSEGNAGDISVKASDSVSISGYTTYNGGVYPTRIMSETSGKGNAGNVFIETGKLSLTDLGWITTNARAGSEGNAGNISVKAADSVLISGYMFYEGKTRSSSIESNTSSGGSAGHVVVETGGLAVTDYGMISTLSRGSGNGGTILLHPTSLLMDNNASISAKSSATGRGGDITVRAAESVRLLNGSTITTETLKSDGGNIEIKAPQVVYLFNSGITTSVQGGLGNGGNITIDPRFVVLDKSRIIANAYGGNGGNINIISDYFLASPESTVQASSQLGISGTINITAPDVDLTSSLVVLPANYLDASSLLRDRCAALADEKASSLVITGRGGMPIDPGDYLPSP